MFVDIIRLNEYNILIRKTYNFIFGKTGESRRRKAMKGLRTICLWQPVATIVKNISLGREGSVLMFLFIGYFIILYLEQSREGAYRKCYLMSGKESERLFSKRA